MTGTSKLKTLINLALICLISINLVACSDESQPLLDNGRGSSNTTSTLSRNGDLGNNERGETEVEVDEDQAFYDSLGPRDQMTRSFTNMDLSDDQIEDMAEKILELQEMDPGKFRYSSNVSLVLIMLKYMSELGDFEVGARDLGVILKGFGDLAGQEFSTSIWDVVRQVKKVRIGIENGRTFVQIFTKGNGRLIYRIFERMDDDILETVQLNNREKIYLDPIDSMVEVSNTLKFLDRKETFLGFEIGKLNQIHPDIKRNAWNYLDDVNKPYPAMMVTAPSAFIKTRKRKVNILKMYTFPGLRKADGTPLPSIVIRGKTGRFKLKMSIDQ